MNTKDRQAWIAKTTRLNEGADLTIGTRVKDPWGAAGVVKLIEDWAEAGPLTVENHGTVTVLLDSGEDEHYCLYNWNTILRREES
jgi:hypothetical protein